MSIHKKSPHHVGCRASRNRSGRGEVAERRDRFAGEVAALAVVEVALDGVVILIDCRGAVVVGVVSEAEKLH